MRATILTITLLAIASLLAWYWWFRLPPPERATRQQLLKWLVLRDLEQQERQTQLAMMERLEQELARGVDLSPSQGLLTDKQQAQLDQNARLLSRLWFTTRVRQYHRIQPEARIDFLRRQIDTLMAWTRIREQLESNAAADSADAQQLAATSFDQIEQWIGQAEPPLQQQMYTAVHDAVIAWLATSDLRDVSAATRRELALRIAEALSSSESARAIRLPLSDRQRGQLIANAQLLAQSWFYVQAERYGALPQEQRTAFVDERLEEFFQWGIVDLLAPPPQDGARPSRLADLWQLMSLLEKWIAEAPAEQRSNLRSLATHVQQRLLWRQLRGLLPIAGERGTAVP